MLKLYFSTPFQTDTEVDQDDFFTGDGVTKTFTLVNKTGTQLAETIQVNALQYRKADGGFTVSGNDFTMASAPAPGAQIIAPGIGYLTLSAFDQDPVSGYVNPRVSETPFWVADIEDITSLQYSAAPTEAGIKFTFTDNDSATVPDSTWVQFAPSLPDGTADTYEADDTPITTTDILAESDLDSGASALDTSITLVDSTGFLGGDYIFINPGEVNAEVTKITDDVIANTVTIYGLQFDHDPGEPVYVCGRQFWVKLTIPLNALGGTPVSLFDLSIDLLAKGTSRV